MAHLTWFKMSPAAWRNDLALRSCSPLARGCWAELMFLAHLCEPYGHLALNGKAMTPEVMAGEINYPVDMLLACLQELEAAGVFSRTEDGTIYSRRMVSDEAKRLERTRCGKRGGNPALVNHDLNVDLNQQVNLDGAREALAPSLSISILGSDPPALDPCTPPVVPSTATEPLHPRADDTTALIDGYVVRYQARFGKRPIVDYAGAERKAARTALYSRPLARCLELLDAYLALTEGREADAGHPLTWFPRAIQRLEAGKRADPGEAVKERSRAELDAQEQARKRAEPPPEAFKRLGLKLKGVK